MTDFSFHADQIRSAVWEAVGARPHPTANGRGEEMTEYACPDCGPEHDLQKAQSEVPK